MTSSPQLFEIERASSPARDDGQMAFLLNQLLEIHSLKAPPGLPSSTRTPYQTLGGS
jgi:hypothetical protein